MSVAATVLTLLIGFPVAYHIAKMTRGRSKTILFLLCLILWVSEQHLRVDDPLLRESFGLFSGLLQYAGLANQPVEFSLQRRRHHGRPWPTLDAVHGGAADHCDRWTARRFQMIEASTAALAALASIWREIVIPHAMPGIVWAVSSPMLSLGDYHADPARRQGQPVVHRADLHPVHHPL
ncbi:MAG: hypothetical protein R3D43_02790 [Tepidamorphaceae bacterium]